MINAKLRHRANDYVMIFVGRATRQQAYLRPADVTIPAGPYTEISEIKRTEAWSADYEVYMPGKPLRGTYKVIYVPDDKRAPELQIAHTIEAQLLDP